MSTRDEDWTAITDQAYLNGARYAEGCMLLGIDPWALTDAPLSGEWADDPTDDTIVAEVLEPSERADLNPEDADAIVEAWLRGYRAEQDEALSRAEMNARRENRGIVSYLYQADEVRHQDLVDRLPAAWLSPAAHEMSAEDVLDQAAAYLGIDRDDEYTFDSDDFPKVARIEGEGWVA